MAASTLHVVIAFSLSLMWASQCVMAQTGLRVGWSIHCPRNSHLSRFSSRYVVPSRDRTWDNNCAALPEGAQTTNECRSIVANRFGESFIFTCPNDGVITALSTSFQAATEDREFNFTCCRTRATLYDIHLTNYVTQHRAQQMSWQAYPRVVVVGVFSRFFPAFEDLLPVYDDEKNWPQEEHHQPEPASSHVCVPHAVETVTHAINGLHSHSRKCGNTHSDLLGTTIVS